MSRSTLRWPQSIRFGHAVSIIIQRGRCSGGSSKTSTRRRWWPVPRRDAATRSGFKGVDAAQLPDVNQAHEQVAYLRPIQGPIEQYVLSSKTARFSARSQILLSSVEPGTDLGPRPVEAESFPEAIATVVLLSAVLHFADDEERFQGRPPGARDAFSILAASVSAGRHPSSEGSGDLLETTVVQNQRRA